MTHDVVIIGGGLAGLTAARDFRAAGRTVIVLEARDRLGGRTLYRRFADTDKWVEFGGTWFSRDAHSSLAAEIERYELDVTQSPTPVEFRSLIGGTRRTGRLPVPPDEAGDVQRAHAQLLEASWRISSGARLDQQELADLDISFEAFLQSLELPAETTEYLSAWWAGFSFGCDAADISALHILSWVAGFGATWAWDDVPAEKFARGTASLVEALAEAGSADLRLGAPVARIAQDGSGVRCTTRDGETIDAAAAILATPLNTWGDIDFTPRLSQDKQDAAAMGHAGHAVKLWALVEDAPHGLTGVGSGAFNWVSEEFVLPEGRLLVGIGSKAELLSASQPEQVEAAVRQFAPEARLIATDGHDWNADEFSKGTWLAFRPGQASSFQTALQRSEGRLVFAGSDTATTWPGFMDGAIESGGRAAARVTELLSGTRLTAQEAI